MRRHAILFGASIVLLLATISFFGFDEVVSAIAGSDARLVASAIAIQIVLLLIYAYRLKLIAGKYKRFSFRDAFYTSTIGHFADMITPIEKVGGQPVMIMMIRKKIGTAKASAIVAMDTMTDILSLILILIVILAGLNFLIPYQLLIPLIIFLLVVLALALGVLELFLSRHVLGDIVGWFMKRIKLLRKMNAALGVKVFGRAFRSIIGDRDLKLKAMALSIITKLLEMLRLWLIFLALGTALSLPVLLIAWAFMLLLLFIPWLPGNMGLYEFGSYSALMLFGITSSVAATGVILDRLVSFWFVLIFSLAVIWASNRRVSEIIRMKKKRSKLR